MVGPAIENRAASTGKEFNAVPNRGQSRLDGSLRGTRGVDKQVGCRYSAASALQVVGFRAERAGGQCFKWDSRGRCHRNRRLHKFVQSESRSARLALQKAVARPALDSQDVDFIRALNCSSSRCNSTGTDGRDGPSGLIYRA